MIGSKNRIFYSMLLKQLPLPARHPELTPVEAPFLCIHLIQLAVFFILLLHHLCNASFTPHACAPSCIVYFSIVTLLDQVPYFISPVGKVLIQPVVE